MDKEKQKDEILALESIYNKEEFSYSIVKDHYEMTMTIFISLPEGYFFTYTDDQDEKTKQKIQISHLPPLILHVTLPEDYPSTSPPKFTLRSCWLKTTFLWKLCKKLDNLWKESEGQEILFTWINFLQSEILEFLHIEEFIDISFAFQYHKNYLEKSQKNLGTDRCKDATSAKENLKDEISSKENKLVKDKQLSKSRCKKNRKGPYLNKRAVFNFLTDSNPVKMLVDYNSKRNDIEFQKSFHSCKICFSDKIGENCTRFSPCTHIFCKDCITGYFESKIKEGAVQNMRCPDENCKSEASPNQIKDLITPELFSIYDTILLNTTLDTMTDIIYCPRKFCQYPVIKEPNEVMANCPICKYAFCIRCKAVYHGIDPCKLNSVEKENLVKEYQEASAEKKHELELRYGKKQLQTLVENTMSENWIQNNSQACPKCNTAIEKSDGCNKMICWKCKTFFCWLCSVKLNKEDPYDHFRNPKSECYKKLLEGTIINDDEYFEDEDEDDDYEDFMGYDDEFDYFSDEFDEDYDFQFLLIA